MWIQENTSTNKKEVCHVFPQGTVCIDPTRLDSYEGSITPTYYDNIVFKNPITTPAIYDNEYDYYYCDDGDYDENNNICVICSNFELDNYSLYYSYDSESGKCYNYNYYEAEIQYDSENNKYYKCPDSESQYDQDSQKCLGSIYPENGYSITKYNELKLKSGDYGCSIDEDSFGCYDSEDGSTCSVSVSKEVNYDENDEEIISYKKSAECSNYDSVICSIGDPNYDDSCH